MQNGIATLNVQNCQIASMFKIVLPNTLNELYADYNKFNQAALNEIGCS